MDDSSGLQGTAAERGMGWMRDATKEEETGLAGEVLGVIRAEGILGLPEDFGVTDDLFLAGMDSMAVMQLLVALEERFGVAFAAGDVTRERFRSAAALAEWLGTRRQP